MECGWNPESQRMAWVDSLQGEENVAEHALCLPSRRQANCQPKTTKRNTAAKGVYQECVLFTAEHLGLRANTPHIRNFRGYPPKALCYFRLS